MGYWKGEAKRKLPKTGIPAFGVDLGIKPFGLHILSQMGTPNNMSGFLLVSIVSTTPSKEELGTRVYFVRFPFGI